MPFKNFYTKSGNPLVVIVKSLHQEFQLVHNFNGIHSRTTLHVVTRDKGLKD